MIDILKSIILDFQEVKLETGILRRLKIEVVPGKATICIGVRRSGKSTYMFQVIQRLMDEEVPRENILYLNFFDDRLHNLRLEGLGLITEAYYSLYPEKKNAETVYCFFDEIQAVDGWEPFVDRLMRTEKCEVYITGSSAQMLSKEIATQMRGRALSWELCPFSFKEFLDYKRINVTGHLATKKRLLVQKAFEEYWETGGFPEVVGLDRRLRIKIHQEYFHAILFRDLVERHDISHPKAVLDLAHRLIDNTASLYSINSLTGYLKSLGHKAPKSAVRITWRGSKTPISCLPCGYSTLPWPEVKPTPRRSIASTMHWSPRWRQAFSSTRGICWKTLFLQRSGVLPPISITARQRAAWRWISWRRCRTVHVCWFRSANPWPSRKPGNGKWQL
jgi:hypothetical protein